MHTLTLGKWLLHVLSLIIISSLLTSCMSTPLAVYIDYLSHENLASYAVGTPDPYLNNPNIGQRLIVTWSLKKKYSSYKDLSLKIYIRFRNTTETIFLHPISRLKGTYVYTLLNQDYLDSCGILTYKVELIGDGLVLEEWRHQIWTPIIRLEDDTTPASEATNDFSAPENLEDDINLEEDIFD